MDRQRIFAIFVGLLMLFSVAGYANFGLGFIGNPAHGNIGNPAHGNQQQQSIPTLANRSYSGQEISFLLNNGRTVAEAVYNKACDECRGDVEKLKTLANENPGFLFVSIVETDYGEGFDKFQILGVGGRIIDLTKENISLEHLSDLFCEVSAVKTADCLLKIYDKPFGNNT